MDSLILSDLHFEFHADYGDSFLNSIDVNPDLCILAGDLCSSEIIEECLYKISNKFKKTIYVPGNHEFYGSSIPEVKSKIKSVCKKVKNIYFLDNKKININGINFIGGTLWFPQNAFDFMYKKFMSDFSEIKNFTNDVYLENAECVEVIKKCNEGDILLTHHLVSDFSIDDKFKNSPLNIFFVTNLDYFINEYKPKYAIHGHTHESLNYMLGDTNVICNPFGYVGNKLNPNFNDKLIIKL